MLDVCVLDVGVVSLSTLSTLQIVWSMAAAQLSVDLLLIHTAAAADK